MDNILLLPRRPGRATESSFGSREYIDFVESLLICVESVKSRISRCRLLACGICLSVRWIISEEDYKLILFYVTSMKFPPSVHTIHNQIYARDMRDLNGKQRVGTKCWFRDCE